ncbi:MAG: site-specific integrase [Acidobacteriota bacterium]|nr:site-specific integrase [Acidobacteriota bacterium]
MKLAPGVFRDRHGLRAFQRTKTRGLRSKRFPADDLSAAKQWRKDEQARAQLGIALAPPPVAAGTLDADAVAYLKAVAGMSSYADRTRDIAAWCAALGPRSRSTITALDVRQALEQWRKDHKYAGSTLNHRRTALMHLYRVLDGKGGYNPVADVPKYPEHEHAALVHTPADIARALARVRDPKCQRILSVAAWTGWPYATICRLVPADLSRLDKGLARVTPRRKGRGTAGRWMPLLPKAIAALRALQIPSDIEVGARGTTDTHRGVHRKRLHAQWVAACTAAKIQPCRPYDLRHAFGTLIAVTTHDSRAVSELMMHTNEKQTRRYTDAAGIVRATAAIAQVTRVTAGGRKRPEQAGGKWNARTSGKRKNARKTGAPGKI